MVYPELGHVLLVHVFAALQGVKLLAQLVNLRLHKGCPPVQDLLSLLGGCLHERVRPQPHEYLIRVDQLACGGRFGGMGRLEVAIMMSTR
jgi:hypothetical protein